MRDHRRRLRQVEDRLKPLAEYVSVRWNDPDTREKVPGVEERIAAIQADGKVPLIITRYTIGQEPPDCPKTDIKIHIDRRGSETWEDYDRRRDGWADGNRGSDN